MYIEATQQARTLAGDFLASLNANGISATLRTGQQPQRQACVINPTPVRNIEQVRAELARYESLENAHTYGRWSLAGSEASRFAGQLRAELASLEAAQ